ncbi:hypothetical protein [Enterococcus mundtii]|uniref:hypothetical protein n=1 Tax=Enterococcus mundtii TaxID=53346 RepID=UPI0035C77849
MGIRNGIQTNTRPFYNVSLLLWCSLLEAFALFVLLMSIKGSQKMYWSIMEKWRYHSKTRIKVRFKLEKISSEALQFSVNLIDSKGEKIPLMIDDQSITENQVLTEEQFSTLHFTKPTEPVRLFVKYKSANGTLTDLTPPEGEILPLVEQENNDQSGTSGVNQPTK